MVELTDVVTSVTLLVAGTLLGALLTYEFSMRQEKRHKDKRRIEVASILYDDIVSRLTFVLGSRHRLKSSETIFLTAPMEVRREAVESIEGIKSAFNRDTYTAFLPEMPLLPERVVVNILTFYSFCESQFALLWRHLEKGEGSSVRNAMRLCDQVWDKGRHLLALLETVIQKIGINEAERVVDKSLGFLHDLIEEGIGDLKSKGKERVEGKSPPEPLDRRKGKSATRR